MILQSHNVGESFFRDLTADQLYILLLRSSLNFDEFSSESNICFHHEMYYVTSDKLFNKPNNKCCNPFHLHATERLVFG